MKTRPLVSILILNHNNGRHLRAAIASALAQTYPRLEVIVVDDGSSDESPAVIRDLGRRVVPVLKLHAGEASAINAGYRHCQGDLICLLDAGDTFQPSKINEVVEASRLHPRAGLIYHRVRPLNERGHSAGQAWPERLLNGDIKATVMASGGWWPAAPCSGLSLRRSIFEQALDIPKEEFRRGAALYLTDIAPFLAPVVGLDRVLGHVRAPLPPCEKNAGSSREECLAFWATRNRRLNEKLRHLSIPHPVSLDHHWPYQSLRFQHGEGPSLWEFGAMALRFPGEPDLPARIRNVAHILADMSLASAATTKVKQFLRSKKWSRG